jgi:hypothetical protein
MVLDFLLGAVEGEGGFDGFFGVEFVAGCLVHDSVYDDVAGYFLAAQVILSFRHW